MSRVMAGAVALLVSASVWVSTSTALAGDDAKWSHHSGDIKFVIGFEKGQEMAQLSGKPMMLFFTTTWCGWCKKLAGESFVDPQVVAELTSFVPVIVDGDTEKATCQKYGVSGYPNIKFVTSDDKRHAEVAGYVDTKSFLAKVADAKKSIGEVKFDPKYVRYLSTSAKKLHKEKKYHDALLTILEIQNSGADEKTVGQAAKLKEKIEKTATEALEKAKRVRENDPAAARKLFETIKKEFFGLEAAKEAAKLLG
ncbi:MAG: thioredoxin family protein [Planctomycetes bacterium]|nr:thioredoxin family protein [Planctomycetota bacterium]